MTNNSTSLLAKIFGWANLGLQFFGQIVSNPVHGWQNWLAVAASAAVAVATHAASNTPGPTPSQH